MKKWAKPALLYLVLLVVAAVFFVLFSMGTGKVEDLNYNEFLAKLDNSEIVSIVNDGNRVVGELNENKKFTTYIPPVMAKTVGEKIQAAVDANKVEVVGKPPAKPPFILEILPMLLISAVFIGFMWFVFSGNQGGSKAMNFGKNRAKLAKATGKKVTFADVAGLKEEKEELMELVDFLKSPKKYRALGARIPKGVLMVGRPGTGKTYLSKATAGEAGVPFYSISGSDFVEMFVGVGASRVRDLFEESKKNAPCIVFIDEIDAVGRKRGSGLGGGHDEREQTLNQLLVEMDGFSENQGVIIIAATNRPDVLDNALLRPGRFDRQILVGMPDIREREAILEVHSKNKPIASDVSYSSVAQQTPGFTPADLENVMNESALLAARGEDRVIRMDTIKRAITKVIAGVEKKSRIVTEKERRITAYHEAGHAVLARVLPDADPVHQVTIIPRGHAGGFTLQFPEEDRSYSTKSIFENELVILMGGRVAEQIMLGDISTGASNDFERVAKIARDMVTKYAMSENLGAMSYDTGEELFIGRDFGASKEYSDHVAATIDHEIRLIVDSAYEKANNLLEENRDKIEIVAQALLKYETISGDEFRIAFNEGNEALDAFIADNNKRVEADRERLEKEYEEKERIEKERIKKEIEMRKKLQEQKLSQNTDGASSKSVKKPESAEAKGKQKIESEESSPEAAPEKDTDSSGFFKN